MQSPLTYTDQGNGPPVLLLHGGGGPQTVAPFARLLAERARVITPTHPGFAGTERPDALNDIPGLAARYVQLLDDLDIDGVTVIGNSIGGWVAAEMAVAGSPRVNRYVLVDAVGIEVPGHPVVDFFSLSLPEVADYSYFEPDKYRIDLDAMPPEQKAQLPGNRAALETYAGRTMQDPTLRDRLADVSTPTLVLWGEADRIADPDYGRAYAAAFGAAEFRLLERTGHLPQVETPQLLLDALSA